MADMLSSGVSALLAFQRALDTTSHNIANAGTAGYSRQSVALATREPQGFGNGWIGSGVQVTTVRRNYSEVLAAETRGSHSTFAQLEVLAGAAERMNNLFADSNSGIGAALQKFDESLQAMASSPASIPARQVVLSQAQSLITRLQSYQGNIEAIDRQISTQLAASTDTVSNLARQMAIVNEQIVVAQGLYQQPPNDLLDQRERLLGELSRQVNVTSVPQSDGSINVFIGTGQMLVNGARAASLRIIPDTFAAVHQRIALDWQGQQVDVTNAISGGAMAGLLQARAELVTPALNQMGLAAATLASLANDTHSRGLDLNADFGGALFAAGAARALPASSNSGTAVPQVTRENLGALTGGDYVLRYDGASWTLSSAVSGVPVPTTGDGSAANPLRADGIAIVAGAGALAGDAFLVQPTAAAVSGLRLLIDQPQKLAAAAPLIAAASAGNAGSVRLDAASVSNPLAWVRGAYTLRFDTASSWQVLNASGAVIGSGAYTSGASIAFNGMSLTLSGTPVAGDSFSVRDTPPGSTDNRNAAELTRLMDRPVLGNATVSVNQSFDRLVGRIGVQTSQAQLGRDAQQTLHAASSDALLGVSGVNLDEEAANLVRFQQAYEAAARVIGVANTMFQSLLRATER